MSIKYKKSYQFALRLTALISAFCLLTLSILEFFIESRTLIVACFIIIVSIFCFLVTQYRVEKFIYRNIQKIYKKVSLLDKEDLGNKVISTDMETLRNEVYKFAHEKKIEIETLRIKEEYRREFIGNVSHELKTPLFTVQGYISTLSSTKIKDKDIRKKYLQRAEDGIERLISIVESLDMITKFENNEMLLHKESFNIVQTFVEIFEMLELKAEEKGITLMFDKNHYREIKIFGDKEKISRVIINLLENSIKYGRENGSTEISFENLTEDKIIVSITDNGKGIEQKHIPRIFERFYRVDQHRTSSTGGSGLGLAIVKHIIEAHNEKISIDSTLGKGTKISFTLQKTRFE